MTEKTLYDLCKEYCRLQIIYRELMTSQTIDEFLLDKIINEMRETIKEMKERLED